MHNGLTRQQFRKAVLDLRDGWDRKTLWLTLAIQDIRQRYRRSLIGPFWITLSLGITVAALGFLYGSIFNLAAPEFIPYLAAGYTVWALLSQLIIDGTETFIRAEKYIGQLAAPLSVHVFRTLWTNILILAHNIWVFIVAALIFSVEVRWSTLLAVPGLLLVLLNGFWIALLLGQLSARFRDIPLIVHNLVNIGFFMTPILWKADMLPERAAILAYNPAYHFVEIVRAPLLGQVPTLYSWGVAILVTCIGWLLAMFFYTVYRWRIAYWV